jgi:hypothetical protein
MEGNTMTEPAYKEMFEKSKKENSGLTLFVQGQTIAGMVFSYSEELVQLRSQQY